MKMRLLLSLLISLFTSFALAAETGSMKIGILDAEKVLRSAPQVATINKNLEKQFRGPHDNIMKLQQTLQAEIEKINRDGATMSEKDRGMLQDKIIADKTKLRGDQEAFQQNLANAQEQAMGKFMETLKGVIAKIAKDQQYDLILLKQATAYHSDKADISDAVLAALKK